MTNQTASHTKPWTTRIVTVERPNDETIEIHVNGQVVATATHDEHGWSGMDAVERTALAIARALGGPCPCTCHQPDRRPCKPGTPAHRHGAGGYCTVAGTGRHVLVVGDDRTWTVAHPADCTITPRNGGPSGLVCLVEDLAREQLHDDRVPPPGRYEVEANDIGDKLCIFDRLDGQPPAVGGCRCSTDDPAEG